jgi:hypothetical protein
LGNNTFNTRLSHDLQADTAILVGQPQDPSHGIIVEIQQDKKPAKRRQLPRYAAAFWLHLNRPVTVLVVCPDPDVADWYTDHIRTELPGYVLRANVLGPKTIPVITNPRQVAAQPELATIGVAIHGWDREVADAFLKGISQLKSEHAKQYDDYAKAIAPLAIRRILEEIMETATESDMGFIATEFFGRGRAEEGAKTILMVLSARDLTVSDEARERITACGDIDQLESWVRRAATAESTDDIFR